MARLSLLALIASAVAFVGVQAVPLPHEVRTVYIRDDSCASATATASASATATASASDATASATSTSSSSSNGTTASSGTFQQLEYASRALWSQSCALILIPCSYSQFQISDGTGGDAEAQANAVFVGECNQH